jgi:hypothetical protein
LTSEKSPIHEKRWFSTCSARKGVQAMKGTRASPAATVTRARAERKPGVRQTQTSPKRSRKRKK